MPDGRGATQKAGERMSAISTPAQDVLPAAAGGSRRRKLLLVAAPVLLLLLGGGAWMTGLLGGGAAPAAAGAERAVPPPAFVDMPDILTNLNAIGRRPVFIKLRAKIELARGDEAPQVQAAMPRLVDLFQTYLREMRPEELRGSAGTHRLREELIARANVAAAPVRIADVLFVEVIVQ